MIVIDSPDDERRYSDLTKMEIAAAVSYDIPIMHAMWITGIVPVIKADILNKARFERYTRKQMYNQQYGLNMALNNAAGNFCSLGFNQFA